jgi:hypothetical protein
MDGQMPRRGLLALVLAAFLARVVLPAFHFHEEGGHGGECGHEHRHPGPAVAAAHEDCAVCELLALKVPGVEPEPPQHVGQARPSAVGRAHTHLPALRPAFFWVVCGPRGPPASSSA